MKIITLTMNPAVDINSRVKQVVVGRKLRCRKPRYEAGGGGINVSRALRKLGGDSAVIFPAGGASGEKLLELLHQERVSAESFEFSGITRENFTVGEETSDNQYRFVMPGQKMTEKEWRCPLSIIENLSPAPQYIVASGSLPPGVPDDFYKQVSAAAAGLKAKFIVDSSGQPLKQAIAGETFLIKPNMREIKNLVDDDIDNEDDLKKALEKLCHDSPCRTIVVSLGAGGALLATNGGYEHIRAPTVPVRSKIGAGDSMVAGIVKYLADGHAINEAVRYGVAAGAAAVMTPGTELCRRKDADKLYAQIGSEGK